MAGTHYGALNFTLEEEKKQASPLKKSGAVAAVVVAVCVMFFAGRVHKSLTTPFTHEDVMNVAATCGKGQFIGGCKPCRKCLDNEYNNGGCSMFKDTFCSYCDPIPHCHRLQARCTKPFGGKKFGGRLTVTTCQRCDCHKVPTAYGQKTLEQIEYYKNTWSAKKQALYTQRSMQFSCFFNEGKPWSPKKVNTNRVVSKTKCRACTVCPKNYYQTKACNQAGNEGKDTQCRACRVCKRFQYTKTPCKYAANTVCGQCVNCAIKAKDDGKFLFQPRNGACTSNLNKNVYAQGKPGHCATCASNGKGKFFIEKPCRAGTYKEECAQDVYLGAKVCGWVYQKNSASNTKFKKCSGCKPGTWINKPCDVGVQKPKLCRSDPFIKDGAWEKLVAGKKVTFDKNRQSKQCGQYKMGHDDQCSACAINAGCKKGGKSCKKGEFLKKVNGGMSTEDAIEFRTRRCDNKADFNGDATYDTCKECTDYQYVSRNCSPECVSFKNGGKCIGGKNNGKACTLRAAMKNGVKVADVDAQCPGGFCGGQCSLVKSGKRFAPEDGKMAKNQLGTQIGCINCPDQFLIGTDANDKPVVSKPGFAPLRTRCAVKNKRCQKYAPEQFRKTDGMRVAPKFSTCDNGCTTTTQFKKFGNCCKNTALGSACEWERSNRICITPYHDKSGKKRGMPYRVATAKTGGFKGFKKAGVDPETGRRYPLIDKKEGSHTFIRWCRQMCEEFPSCTMFSVSRGLFGKEKVTDGTKCKLFKDDVAAYVKDAGGPVEPMSKEDVKNLLKTDGKGWTCQQGASVFAHHKTGKFADADAGFACKAADRKGVSETKKCKNAFCKGDAGNCCVQAKDVCYRKNPLLLAHQRKMA